MRRCPSFYLLLTGVGEATSEAQNIHQIFSGSHGRESGKHRARASAIQDSSDSKRLEARLLSLACDRSEAKQRTCWDEERRP